MTGPPASYAASGVDIDAGERAVQLIAPLAEKTRRPEVVGGLGGFAGLFRLDLRRYSRPLLASSTDGVGTKLAIAQALGVHDTVGHDLIGMVADDLVICGAEPLFVQDYIACGRVVPDRLEEIVRGIADGCRIAGCSLVGGETAEHPGILAPDVYDLSATGVGVVDEDQLIGADRVAPGDVAIALGSSGLHSNGYSLVRHALLDRAGIDLESTPDELGGATLGEVLLTPTWIYARDCLALIAESDVHALAHITGGGIASNLARVLPASLDVTIERTSWTPGPVFEVVSRYGTIERSEMERTFNQGIGMVALCAAEDADRALALLVGRGIDAWIAGSVGPGSGVVTLSGNHPAGDAVPGDHREG